MTLTKTRTTTRKMTRSTKPRKATKLAKSTRPKKTAVVKPKDVVLHLTVTTTESGNRVDKALTLLAEAQASEQVLSRARIQALIDEGRVALSDIVLGDQIVKDPSRKAQEGETYLVTLPPPVAPEPQAQDIDLDIVFEDKDLLVINKPVGMVVHPAPGNHDNTLVNALIAHCGKSLSGIGGVARPGIVHRLDKDTSGLMVVAKNDLAHQGLTEQFADRSLSRTYLALVWGEPIPRFGMIEAPIGRHPRDRVKMAVIGKGRYALTHYKVTEVFGDLASLVECKLETGRTHQIRVHLAHIKHPVVGDGVYGKGRNRAGAVAEKLARFPRQALHAYRLEFIHPRTDKKLMFEAKLPKDMADLLKLLRKK